MSNFLTLFQIPLCYDFCHLKKNFLTFPDLEAAQVLVKKKYRPRKGLSKNNSDCKKKSFYAKCFRAKVSLYKSIFVQFCALVQFCTVVQN